MRTFSEYLSESRNQNEAHVQAKHFDTNEYDVIPDGSRELLEAVSKDPENEKRIIIRHDGDGKAKGVSGLSVPKHMWLGTPPTAGGHKNKKGEVVGPTAGITGMQKRNVSRAEVYGSEPREPLSVPEMEASHKVTLDQHFAMPKVQQISHEKTAISRLKAAKHLDSGSTTDESEKTDTILHEKDKNGKGYMASACKGVAGHTVYTSGGGDEAKHRIVNTCPGQTRGCGGGVDAHGVANTTKGTCFAPNAEAQYPSAAVRRSYLDQSKHDPKMTTDYILAHVHSIRSGAEKADKQDKHFVIRPNTLNENDRSTKHVVVGLNAQRKTEGKGSIMSYQYSKDNELHDPENGVHVTHSNIGPKVINSKTVKENVNRDVRRVNNTVNATSTSGEDLRNAQGNKTPAKHSYLVTNLPRGGDLDKQYIATAKHIKYWDKGTKLSDEEKASSLRECHFDGAGKPTSTANSAHHGFKVLGDRKYEYQKQHILHPRMTQVNGHAIPSDSRFQDDHHMPSEANKFKAKNGKAAGGIVVTSATTSTSGERSNSSFTHRIDQAKLDHIKHTGEHEIDAPEEQEAARGHEYNGEEQTIKVSSIGGLKKNKPVVKESLDDDGILLNEAKEAVSVVGADGSFNERRFSTGIKRIERLTDTNFHTKAIAHGARLLGLNDVAKKADDIEKTHMKIGYLSDELATKRGKAYDEVYAHAKKVLSPTNVIRLHKSY